MQGNLTAGGASTVLSGSVLFVREAVLGWGSRQKLKSDWGIWLDCDIVSGAGTLGGRAANLLPVSKDMA